MFNVVMTVVDTLGGKETEVAKVTVFRNVHKEHCESFLQEPTPTKREGIEKIFAAINSLYYGVCKYSLALEEESLSE